MAPPKQRFVDLLGALLLHFCPVEYVLMRLTCPR
jgi:hypothetical protein